MAAEAAGAPGAASTGEVDFAGDTAARQRGVVRLDNLAHELVSGDAPEAVVAALQLEVGVADAGQAEADKGEPGRTAGTGTPAEGDAAPLEVNGKHMCPWYAASPDSGTRNTRNAVWTAGGLGLRMELSREAETGGYGNTLTR